MTFKEAEKTISSMERLTGITHTEHNSLASKAAAIMLYCSVNEWEVDDILKVSGYKEEDIQIILVNLIEKGHLFFDNLVMNDPGTDEINWREFLTIARDVAGLIRCEILCYPN